MKATRIDMDGLFIDMRTVSERKEADELDCERFKRRYRKNHSGKAMAVLESHKRRFDHDDD